ncbi:molybdate ABC transporter substrate-binding protein [Alkalihalobacillus pseudalcaliphilus]|uniref:molybdate ABC transporter substrate-binding protein n=1 Tax=Alkalihalobacillus pseudalcaliphilus TaxID=79884 RepID=UPI00064DEDF4|nr:molybdate ABC transporter substrate-binding protein [Alkalihalobacillus pseudalcaliphilus]KMK78089.1 molybdenum ABC transporter substrate-binding protein [Alkalihalobacillus pseudalcaliphilus]
MKKLLSIIYLCTLLLFACSTEEPDTSSEQEDADSSGVELTISAAASLSDALTEIQASFEEEYPHIQLLFNFGSSGTLQQQISQGAPADLFFSAAEDKFHDLIEEGLINEENGIDLVGNSIVLVTPTEYPNKMEGFSDLTKAESISIGTPESVPAGKYAKESLENLNIWSTIKDKVVFAKDVRQVLTYVETGNVEAGIVYHTDALISDKVNIVELADSDTHAPVIYPVGVINTSTNSDEAFIFYEYLQTDAALEILESYGFSNLLN